MKLLLTAGVIVAVWLLFFKRRQPAVGNGFVRWGGALGKAVRAMADSAHARKETQKAGAPAPESRQGIPATVDLKPCPKCGAYVADGTAHACTGA
jgi:hypothetical protein